MRRLCKQFGDTLLSFSRLSRSRFILVFIFVVAFGSAGSILLFNSHAATQARTVEAEDGTLSSNAVSVTDPTASGGNAVRFSGAAQQSTGMPTAANTGPQPGVTLTTHTGDYVLNTDGATVSNMHITGSLYLSASNVSATNVQVDGSINFNSSPGGNYNFPVSKNQYVSYCQASSIDNVGFDTIGIDHCHIGGISNTFVQLTDYQDGRGYYKADELTFTNNLLDNLLPYTGSGSPHFEAVHFFGVTNAVIRNNVFDYRTSDSATRPHITATITFQDSVYTGQGCENITFDGNWLYGGGFYQIYDPIKGTSSITDNKFTSFPNLSTQYPPETGTTFTQSGNTLDGSAYTLATNP